MDPFTTAVCGFHDFSTETVIAETSCGSTNRFQHLYLTTDNGADRQSCTDGARITAEGGSLKRDLRAGSVCLYVRLFGTVL